MRLIDDGTGEVLILKNQKTDQDNPIDHVVILEQIAKAKPRIEPYRSGGFINRDYDMARISIDLPIIEAKKLMAKLNAI